MKRSGKYFYWGGAMCGVAVACWLTLFQPLDRFTLILFGVTWLLAGMVTMIFGLYHEEQEERDHAG